MDIYNATLRTRNYEGNVSALGPRQLDQRHLRINEIFYGDADSTDDRRPAAHQVQPRADPARGSCPSTSPPPASTSTSSATTARRRKIERPEPDPLRRQPVAAVPAHELAVPVPRAATFTITELAPTPPTRELQMSVEHQRSSGSVEATDGSYRQFYDMRASVTGPILTKVWSTPDNGYAERFKHVDRAGVHHPADHRTSTTTTGSSRSTAADYTFGGTDAGHLRR